uniref:Uncharacterized protein n=1 Tax=Romanomermis culicivorax TaxID=13658 RepID=A0A915KV70_ROMCU
MLHQWEDELKVCECSGETRFTPEGGSCVMVKEGQSEGNPVGGNDLSGSKWKNRANAEGAPDGWFCYGIEDRFFGCR